MIKFFFKNLFSISLFLLSFFLLTYIGYKDQIVWQSSKSAYYIQYYIIIIILILFSIISFFFNKVIKTYLTIFFFSLLVTIYFTEFYYSFIKASINEEAFNQINKNKNFDQRNKFEIYKDFLKDEQNISIVAPAIDFMEYKKTGIFPLSSKSKAKTIHCNEGGFFSSYMSDRYGFNNPDSEWESNFFEYILIGDSYTHGACVNRPYDVGSNLRKISNKSVLNLGFSGSGPLVQLATLKEYLPKNKSKNIIWIYFEGNDPENLNSELKNTLLLKYLTDEYYSQNLKNKVNIINNILEMRINEEFTKQNLRENLVLKLKNFIKISKLREMYQPIGEDKMKEIIIDKKFKKILKLAKKYSENNNSKFHLVYLPEPNRYIKQEFNNPNYKIVKNIASDLNISFIDLDKLYLNNYENHDELHPSNCILCGHFNEKGYELMSKKIFEYLIDK